MTLKWLPVTGSSVKANATHRVKCCDSANIRHSTFVTPPPPNKTKQSKLYDDNIDMIFFKTRTDTDI